MKGFIYKIEEADDYAVRYNPETHEEYAKMKGDSEFKTDFSKNNTGYEASLNGKKVSEEEYNAY